MSKMCFPDGKGSQTCHKLDDYRKLGREAPSWEEECKVILVTDEEFEKKPERK